MVEQTISLVPIIEWLNKNSGALTVIITLVYVAATILIWIANYKSAQATHDQLEESKRQFEETKKANQQQLKAMKMQLEESERQYEETQRLSVMPFICFEKISEDTQDFEVSLPVISNYNNYCHFFNTFRMRNVGNGPATNMVYTWTCKERGIQNTECFPFNAITPSAPLLVTFYYMEDGSTNFSFPNDAELLLEYNDLLGNSYEQRILFRFGDRIGHDILASCDVDVPKFLGKVMYCLADNKETTNA